MQIIFSEKGLFIVNLVDLAVIDTKKIFLYLRFCSSVILGAHTRKYF